MNFITLFSILNDSFAGVFHMDSEPQGLRSLLPFHDVQYHLHYSAGCMVTIAVNYSDGLYLGTKIWQILRSYSAYCCVFLIELLNVIH